MFVYKEWYDADERCAGRWLAGLRVFIHEMVWKFKKREERDTTRIGKRRGDKGESKNHNKLVA